MNKFIYIIAILFFSMLASANEPVLEKLISIAKQSNAKLALYKYNGKDHYLIDQTHYCCDMGATLYNDQGLEVCEYIGFAGVWQPHCNNFYKEAKFMKYVNAANDNT